MEPSETIKLEDTPTSITAKTASDKADVHQSDAEVSNQYLLQTMPEVKGYLGSTGLSIPRSVFK
jgi:hypothetical protein